MPELRLVAIEKSVINIACCHADYPVELAMVLRLVKLFGRHMTRSANALLKAWGITHAECSLLTALYGHRHQTMFIEDLSDAVGEAPECIEWLVVALDKQEFVVRGYDAVDRRKVVASLSDDGAVLVRSILPIINGRIADYVESFAPGELASLLALLKQVMQGT